MIDQTARNEIEAIFYADLGGYVAEMANDDDDDAAERLRRDVADIVRGWNYGQWYCDSPIELRMLGKLLFIDNGFHRVQHIAAPHLEPRGPERFATIIGQQHPIGRYYADFAFEVWCTGRAERLVVECDGHDWHDKTKAQAARDKARDRAFVRRGYRVMRFTGTEIFRNAGGCADEVGHALYTMARTLVEQANRLHEASRFVEVAS